MSETSASVVKAKINNKAVPGARLLSVTVDLDRNQPDMAVLTLGNEDHAFSNGIEHGKAVEVTVGDSNTVIFKGEVVAIEPSYKSGGESTCVVRAFNKLHRLLRGRKSRTFLNATDSSIVSAVLSGTGLVAQCGSTSITHEHVYQHNQTNLEFLRLRAARLGFDVWVDGDNLHFDEPETGASPALEFASASAGDGDGVKMTSCALRMSSAAIVKKVIVRGWDPAKKEEIVGEAVSAASRLGDKTGVQKTTGFGEVETYEVDHPIFSVEEAEAIAKSRLGEASMSYITGDVWVPGNGAIKAGIIVKLEVNHDKPEDLFNGKYLVVGATHVYSHAKGGGGSGGGGGYKTQVRVARDAQNTGATIAWPEDAAEE